MINWPGDFSTDRFAIRPHRLLSTVFPIWRLVFVVAPSAFVFRLLRNFPTFIFCTAASALIVTTFSFVMSVMVFLLFIARRLFAAAVLLTWLLRIFRLL